MCCRTRRTRAATRCSRPIRTLACCGLLAAHLAMSPPLAATHLATGAEWLAFRDEQLADAYGSPLGLTAATDVLARTWWDLTLRASYVWGENDPAHLAFVATTHTGMQMVPVRLQGRLRHPLGSSVQVWGGPELAWSWFRETWEADVPAAGVSARQSDSSSWFGIGAMAGLRVRAGNMGFVRASFEYVWCGTERDATPGNSNQAGSMEGGWSGVSLLWEPPWFVF
jgi:hypothetical protein